MKCQKCGTVYAMNEVKCSNCGEQLRAPDKIFRLRFWMIISCAAIMLLIFIANIIMDSTYELKAIFAEFCESMGTHREIVHAMAIIFAGLNLVTFIFNMISQTKLKNGNCGFFCVLFMILPLLGVAYAVMTAKSAFDLYGNDSIIVSAILCGIYAVTQIVAFIEGLRIRSVQTKVQAHYRENRNSQK